MRLLPKEFDLTTATILTLFQTLNLFWGADPCEFATTSNALFNTLLSSEEIRIRWLGLAVCANTSWAS